MILAITGIFEVLLHWPLYFSLYNIYEVNNELLQRAGFIRANATVATIPFGYAMTVGIGFFLYLQISIQSKFSRRSGLMLLVFGLIASLSRGPWVGAIFLVMVFILTGRKPIQRLVKFSMVMLISLLLVSVLPIKINLVELLPYFGTSDQGTIHYREKLTENSLIVISRNPLLGSANYLKNPEMEAMRHGQEIIDIVNSYLEIALRSGLIALSLFIGFFFTIYRGIYKSYSRLPDDSSEEFLLGRVLLATLAAILLTIFTVSSISIIPIVYWSVAGLGAAYSNMLNPLNKRQNENSFS